MKDFSQTPFLVIWEVTQACDLACRHCRASAQPARNPFELNTDEGFRLLDQVRRLGSGTGAGPLMVFTGGDPLKRPDLFELLTYSAAIGLRTTVTPSATPLLTYGAIRDMKRAGVCRLAVSLDGADAVAHDSFRGVSGSYERTIEALTSARAIGLETQINTTVTRLNKDRLAEIAAIAAAVETRLWSVFFLVPTGRGQLEDDLTASEYEQVFRFLHQTAKTASFDIKTTEAPHYRRFVAQHAHGEGRLSAQPASAIQRQSGIRDGNGMLFISHTGEVFPSGFLPLTAGNIRQTPLATLYRETPLFRVIRDHDRLGGKCGGCEYRKICGGSRARSYAISGDWMGEEPRCEYIPKLPAAASAS